MLMIPLNKIVKIISIDPCIFVISIGELVN